MSNPFLVRLGGFRNLSTSPKKAVSRVDVDARGQLEDLAVSSSRVPERNDVSFAGSVEAMDADEAVVVSGTVQTCWVGQCRRCLEEATGQVSVDVREIFDPNPVEGETYLLRGDSVDLEPLVREAVMLALPQAPLCSEDCAGLCSECGANRNTTDCGCTNEVLDPRWAALDALKE